jgi:hypothetical protein
MLGVGIFGPPFVGSIPPGPGPLGEAELDGEELLLLQPMKAIAKPQTTIIRRRRMVHSSESLWKNDLAATRDQERDLR